MNKNKIHFFLIFFLFSMNTFAQSNDELHLYNFKQIFLPGNDSTYVTTKIVEYSISEDTFNITIETSYSHCNVLQPEYSIDADTLFLGVSIGDTYCMASYANYQFNYKFSKPKQKYIIKWHEQELKSFDNSRSPIKK